MSNALDPNRPNSEGPRRTRLGKACSRTIEFERHHIIHCGQWVALIADVAFQFAHLNEASLKDLRTALGISIRGGDDTKVWTVGHLEILQPKEGRTV